MARQGSSVFMLSTGGLYGRMGGDNMQYRIGFKGYKGTDELCHSSYATRAEAEDGLSRLRAELPRSMVETIALRVVEVESGTLGAVGGFRSSNWL